MMLLIWSLPSCGVFQKKQVPSTVEVVASVNCKAKCIAVTRAFVDEHGDLFSENIRLKAALEHCNKTP